MDLDLITGDRLETSDECPDRLETSDECPDGQQFFGACPDGQQFFENENQDKMEVQDQMEVPSVSSSSHDVPANQLSSPADSMSEPQVNSESEPHLKVLPDRVTRGKPKVSYEPALNSKPKLSCQVTKPRAHLAGLFNSIIAIAD
ncbi:hypothetical protein F0562_018653 [Nyssa sinensis]|uniref:Uncharacterized protein n=1 Tax=Nyssa sinensis TaxID=561372 RepID=A0A5J4ZDC0_9ASTE|nr:hypothetical protein F0562_018653 [Nyssa sinensis]